MIRLGGLAVMFLSMWGAAGVFDHHETFRDLPLQLGFPLFMLSLFLLIGAFLLGVGMLIDSASALNAEHESAGPKADAQGEPA